MSPADESNGKASRHRAAFEQMTAPSGKSELPGVVLLNGDVRRGSATVRRGAMERARDEGWAAVSGKRMETGVNGHED